MARHKKTKRWLVDTWIHPASGTELSIYYYKDGAKFWGRIGDHYAEGDTLADAKREMNKLACDLLSAEDRWARFILVEVSGHDQQHAYRGRRQGQSQSSAEVGFRMECCWLMKADDDRWMTREWERYTAENPGKPAFSGQDTPYSNQKTGSDVRCYAHRTIEETMLPYTEETWEALMDLSKRLQEVRDQLKKFMETPNALLGALQRGALMLGVGKQRSR